MRFLKGVMATGVAFGLMGSMNVFAVMTFEAGTDRPGSDYNNFELSPSATAATCMNACAADLQCKAYTYVVPGVQGANPRCWLKYAVPAPVSSSCCTSGKKS